MKAVKKTLCILIAAVLLLPFSGCHNAPAAETTLATQLSAETSPGTTEASQSQWTPFAGTAYRYVYFYEGGRELEWEEDIIYMASSYLDDYGLVSRFPFRIEWPDDVEYSDQFLNPALRQYWIDETNAMIQDIPSMTDKQILYRIQKLVATLGDAHASVYLPKSDCFPIYFQPFFREDGVDIYTIGLPKNYEELMYAKLTAVNGFSIAEIIDRMRPYVSYENDYWLTNLIFCAYSSSYIIWEDFLKIAGILPEEANSATFRLETADGQVMELELKPKNTYMFNMIEFATHTPAAAYEKMYSKSNYYWYEYLPDADTVYVRINEFEEDSFYTFLTMGNEILRDVRDVGGVDKLVVDLRDNPGGYTFLGYNEFVSVLNRIDIGTLYVLIDGQTFSNGIIMAGTIKRMIPEAILVGTPAGQPPNFFAGMYDGDYVMPNCDTIIRMPTAYNVSLPNYEGNVLMPDILVYPTLEDYINNTDTILEAVLDMD